MDETKAIMKLILTKDIELSKKLILICSEIFNELVDVYWEEEGKIITYEVHFNDDNYYEFDYKVDSSIEYIIEVIQSNVIIERFRDISDECISCNMNNIRHFNKYSY